MDLDGHDLRLLKPTTYMNRSGMSVQALSAYLHIDPPQILVVHDELDLPVGTVRLKRGGGAGGHNGVRDVITQIGADFFRLRIGVGHPGEREDVIDHVLERANREEESRIIEVIGEALDVLPVLLGEGDQKAMHKLHSRGVVPRPHRKERDPDGNGGACAQGLIHGHTLRHRRPAQRRQVDAVQRADGRPASPAENYPFCTIDPNVGVVPVPDPRLER